MRALATIAALLLFPSAARADALEPPPTDCAQGSVGQSSRAGSYCVPTTCASDAQCPSNPWCATRSWPCPDPEPYRCSDEPVALCVVTSTVPTYHRNPDGTVEESSETITTTSGPCESDADCAAEGARCVRARRCVHGSGGSSAATAIRSGCGCRAAGGAGGSGVAALLVLVAFVGLREAGSRRRG